MIFLIIGSILVVLALVLVVFSGWLRRTTGLPAGRVIYTDTRAWGAVEKPLYDAGIGLTGKPDYLLQQGKHLIPVEVKSGRTPATAFDSHIFQVAAYCLLVEKTFGVRPPYGIIHYPGRDFAVDFTPELETALLALLAELRRQAGRKSVGRSHDEPARCHACGFRNTCDQKIN